MPVIETPFTYLDETAIERMVINDRPYVWGCVPDCLHSDAKDEILMDAPVIPTHGSYPIKSYLGLPRLKYGPCFAEVVGELLSDRFRKIVEGKLSLDLSRSFPCILMTGQATGEGNEGRPHCDSGHKLASVVLGFAREWPYPEGRHRVLNSRNIDDFAFEFAPIFGSLFMYKPGPGACYGFVPHKGSRMCLRLFYCDSEHYVRREYFRHGLSALAKSCPPIEAVLRRGPKGVAVCDDE